MSTPPGPAGEGYREAARLLEARQWGAALSRIDQALVLTPTSPGWLMLRAQCLTALGRRDEACAAAALAETQQPGNAVLRDAAGSIFSFAGDQPRALSSYDAAVALSPDNPHFLYNRAAVRRFVGDLDGAEYDYDRVVTLRPDDFEAYKNRSDLRTQTLDRNHLAQLEVLLSRGFARWQGEVQIRHALAKEYEDTGDPGRSYFHLERGARKRREHLSYDVANDVATVDWIIAAHPLRAGEVDHRASQEAPIFIVGLPRSGTTLVERILGSHSAIHPAGELNDFALALVDSAAQAPGGPPQSRRDLVARSATLDFAMLGKEYLRRARTSVPGQGRFTDKMPLNYLYCGLIKRALPQARIVHVTRHPMASAYAMFKTLFKDGYPFSYDLDDIAHYYIAYRRLMDHWDVTLPGDIYELHYERLVADQESETRRLLAFCGLDWEDACLQFHRNASATTTASASQVRRPLYDSSVAQWRQYETQLAPLAAQFTAAGISLTGRV